MDYNAAYEAFQEFKDVYPKRRGANPWVPAQRSFEKAVKKTLPSTIIDGARVYAAEQRELGNVGTPYVCQAVTWLNQQRWKDYQRKQGLTKALTWIAMDDPRWRVCAGRYYAERGVLPPHTPGLGGQGWRFPSEWLGEKKEAGGQTTQPTSARADLFASLQLR
jgi:hypothetical protein